MKRALAITLGVLLCAASASAWGRLGHATVAYIAEQNLTPKAKKAINEYLHGASLVTVASLNDDFKNIMPVDMGSDFTDGSPRVNSLPHTFEAASGTFIPNRLVCDGGRYVKNCLYFLDKYQQNLRQNARNMDDSTRFAQIAYLVHATGDMHCPQHIRYYDEDMTIGYFNVRLGKEEIRYHTLWDDMILTKKRPWSFSDLAFLVDRMDKNALKEATQGWIWEWGEDSARCSYVTHHVKPGEKLEQFYLLRYQRLAQDQLCKAGHRLAKILNETFK